MGLQSQLNDVSSDSIPLLLLAIIAKGVDHLRCLLFSLFRSIDLLRFSPFHHAVDDGLMGSGLAGLILLSEQLNLNRFLSYRYCCSGGDDFDGESNRGGGGSKCVVCVCRLKDGDQVRKLDCGHVFHKECLDGWLNHLNFNCPLCRAPLVADERVDVMRMHVGGDLLEWFSLR